MLVREIRPTLSGSCLPTPRARVCITTVGHSFTSCTTADWQHLQPHQSEARGRLPLRFPHLSFGAIIGSNISKRLVCEDDRLHFLPI
jgi:hypothetical protein